MTDLAEYHGYKYRLQGTGTYKGMWDYWIYNDKGVQFGDMMCQLGASNRSGHVMARSIKGAARKVRKKIDEIIKAQERKKETYP